MKTIGQCLGKILLLASISLVVLVTGSNAPANAHPERQGVCDARTRVLMMLNGKYAEKPVSMGLASNGTVVEVLNSPNGTWTIVMTTPKGVTCLLATGDYWQDIPEQAAETTL